MIFYVMIRVVMQIVVSCDDVYSKLVAVHLFSFLVLIPRVLFRFVFGLPGSAKLFVLTLSLYLTSKFILLVITAFYFRVMGAAALQKYIGSLGGIGASGVGSSSSYSAKDLNKDVTPEKVRFDNIFIYCQLCKVQLLSAFCVTFCGVCLACTVSSQWFNYSL
jgi:hypothetical protein